MNAPHNRALRNFSIITAFATLCLICIGGLVTSHGVGMSVPDWPNTYGYNMFFFPISKWVGGIFYEHSHRLVASGVGFLTTILAIWLYGRNAQKFLRWLCAIFIISGLAFCVPFPAHWKENVLLAVLGAIGFGASFVWPACDPAPRWLRRLGVIAFVAVAVQGVLGGLRVTLFKDQIGIFHALLAQMFFVLVCAIALFKTRWWQSLPQAMAPDDKRFRALFVGTTLLVLVQLAIAATMRHQHAGLSIPDFPLAYGKIWPATDPASIQAYNAQRIDFEGFNPITAFQVVLQMVHRIVALLILISIAFCAGLTRRELKWQNPLTKISALWFGLVVLQVFLGASTIWTNKSADIATAHVAVGALILVTGGLLSIISYRLLSPVTQKSLAPEAGSSFISKPVVSR